MPVDNLATVFGPTLVGFSSAEPTVNHIMVQTKLQQLVNIGSLCNVQQIAVYDRKTLFLVHKSCYWKHIIDLLSHVFYEFHSQK